MSQQEEIDASPAVTELLASWAAGDPSAEEKVMPLVYAQLRRIASRLLRRERQNHTLQTTAVVHEAYLELIESTGIHFENRSRFFGYCAHLMRRLLIHHSRRRKTLKRGGGTPAITLAETELSHPGQVAPDVEALDGALSTLERNDPRKSKIVELRVFGGLTIDETASYLGISNRTVTREWRKALAWLGYQLATDHPPRHEVLGDEALG